MSNIGKILVVDDEVELKNILVESLTTQGYEASGFTSGEDALRLLRNEPFDVLLTDLMMPGMDGLTLLRESLQIDSHLVTIMMTGHGTIQTAVDAMKVGAFDYVLKPFRLQTVLPVLTRAMNTRRMHLENLQLRETVAIYELAQTIAFSLDPQTVVSKLADAALQQTDADEVSVLLPVPDGSDELYVAAVRGDNRERLLGQRVPLEASISGWVARQREPLLLDGEVNDSRFRPLWPHPEIRSSISIPMQVANKLVGTININALSRPRPFTLGQMKALTILASTAAAALESGSLYGQVRQAEEKYRSLFENAVEGIFQSTPEGRFVTMNPAMARTLGYDSPEQAISEITDIDHQVYVHPEDRAESARREKVQGFLRGFEFEARRRDGEKIWLSLNRHSVKDENDIELYREGSVEDITERKRAEATLHFQKSLLESQSEASIDGILVTSDDRKILSFNRRFVDMWGVSETALGSRSDEAALQSVLDKLENPGEFRDGVEYLYRHPEESGRSEIQLSDGRIFDRYTAPIKSVQDEYFGRVWFFRDITERKRAEQALEETAKSRAESLALLDTILSSAPVGFAFHNRNLVYERINETLAAINGLSVEEHIGRTLNDVLPAMAAVLEPLLHKVFDTGEPVMDVELNGETPADPGHKHYWLVSFYPVRIQGGEILGVGVLVSDVTARKQSEQALVESEERYRDLVENAQDIIYVHDLAGKYTACNKAGEEITGYTLAESLELGLEDTVAPEYRDRAREMLKRKLAGERVTAYELELIAKDGHRVPVEVSTRLVIENGVPVGVTGIARDITERKRSEAQLRRLAAAVEETAESVVITDAAGNIQYVNPAFERISGYTREEALNKNPRILKSGKVDDAVYKELWETISRGDVWTGQLTNRRKDGTLFEERATISPVYDESHKIVNFVAVKQDISDLIQLEEQLRQSQKMEAIGQLAGGVAHDFNNLLTAINGYSTLALQRLDESHPIKPYLEEVRKAGDRAANLTRQLLAFGRKQILQPVALNLNDIITDLNKMLRRLIGEDIHLSAKLADGLRKIKADPGQIEQVLVNLVVNARDAMPTGGNLTIETANVELDQEYASRHIGIELGHYVMLAVSDSGCGMNEETRAHIFEPFFTTKAKGKGTGLGLSTVYGIVKQSGGNIWVYSEPGRGTSFKVYFPQLSMPADQQIAPAVEEPIASGSETVLLVEDEDVVRGLATSILQGAGYHVLAANGAEEAFRVCESRNGQIDLLLTDVVMPQASGKEVADRVSSLIPDLKVLFMSGYTDEAIVHHGVLDSNVEFIQKPFTPNALSKKVREVLDSNGRKDRRS